MCYGVYAKESLAKTSSLSWEYLDEKVQVMVLGNQILTTLSQDVAVGVSGLGFAASSAVLEPDIHLPGLNSQLPSKISFLVTIGPLECLEGVLQQPQLRLREPQLLAWPCSHQHSCIELKENCWGRTLLYREIPKATGSWLVWSSTLAPSSSSFSRNQGKLKLLMNSDNCMQEYTRRAVPSSSSLSRLPSEPRSLQFSGLRLL